MRYIRQGNKQAVPLKWKYSDIPIQLDESSTIHLVQWISVVS